MERYLIIKTRDELLRIKIGQILYFEADRNYTKLLLSNGIQFTFAINIGKIEELLETQVAGSNAILMRVGKAISSIKPYPANKPSETEAAVAHARRKAEGIGNIQRSVEDSERNTRKGNEET